MDIKELQKKVIEFRDARDWGQFQRQRSDVRAAEIKRETVFKLEINEKKYPVEKSKGRAKKHT